MIKDEIPKFKFSGREMKHCETAIIIAKYLTSDVRFKIPSEKFNSKHVLIIKELPNKNLIFLGGEMLAFETRYLCLKAQFFAY